MKQNSLKAWILAVRPYSLGNAVILVLAASALAWRADGFQPLVAGLCLLFALLMQCTANLVNDLYDLLKGADQPDRLGPDRALAKGFISMRGMKWGIGAFTLTSAVVGLALLSVTLRSGVLRYGGWELVAVGAACILFAYLYTAGPYPLAYCGLGDVAVILFFGLVPVGCTYYVQTGGWSWEVTLVALACGLAIDTMLMVNNFRDSEQDARVNKKTLVVLLGRGFGRWAYLLLGVGAVACCWALAAGTIRWAGVATLPYLILHLLTWRKMVRIDHGDALNESLGETARNIMLFGALLTIGILIG